MQSQLIRRAAVMALVVVIGATLFGTPSTDAQDSGRDRRLTVDQPVAGTLSVENFAESYILEASAGNTISLEASTTAADLSLALILTDPNGEVVATDGDLTTAQSASIEDLSLETDGTYVVTVMRGTGADGEGEGVYTLLLTGEVTVPQSDAVVVPERDTIIQGGDTYVFLNDGGIEISLQWASAVDLNLEVRDPVGGTLYFDSVTVNSGGEHAGDINGLCEEATADSPTETASWPSGYVPVGSYEIIIYHQQACNVSGPQQFVLTVSVDGASVQTINGVLNPSQNYLARVEVEIDRSFVLFNGGVNAGLDLSLVPNPQDIAVNQVVTGSITNDKPKDGYTFNGTAGQTVTIDMRANTGSLDTLVILLAPDGRRVGDNDDNPLGGTTDSLLQATLPDNGAYTIIATRYGQVIGGTEGNYTLTLSIGTGAVVDAGTSDATPTTPTVARPDGSIEVTLEWFTGADLQLQVRDPNGDTVFDDVTSIGSGGILDENYVGNRGCVESATTPATYYIYWPTNRIPPVGTYEVEVWYQSDCDDPTPVNFNISIEVNGQLLAAQGSTSTVQATATSVNSRYMTTFTIDSVSANLGTGGFFDMNSLAASQLDYVAQLPTAQLIEYDDLVEGRIDQTTKFVAYQFQGLAGDRIAVRMTRIGDVSLDPAVYILDPSFAQVANNDDIEPGANVDSLIDEYQLQRDGTYYIIATHYGLQYGATEGGFRLQLLQLAGN